MNTLIWIALPIILIAFWWFVIHTDGDVGNTGGTDGSTDVVDDEETVGGARERFDRTDRR